MVTEKQLERLKRNADDAVAAYDKALKNYEDELRQTVWDGIKVHIITRQDALEFKRAIQSDAIMEILFKKALLPDEIMDAIARKKRLEKYGKGEEESNLKAGEGDEKDGMD